MAKDQAVPFLNGEVPVADADHVDGKHPDVHEQTQGAPSAETREVIDTDAIVVGAGFSGITAIHRLRKLGKTVKCFESGSDYGGVWYWNRYPGARVDSEMPYYQLNIPEVYSTWQFEERFPGHQELRRYVAHVDQVLDLRKDTYFHARVIDCRWDETTKKWTIKTQQGHVATANYLILATGLLHRTYTPDFPGLADYKGELYHTGAWDEKYTAKGKKVGVIGSGATAVQVVQELGKEADELVNFLRRPSYCLAMKQRPLSKAEQIEVKAVLPALFTAGRDSIAGFPLAGQAKTTFEVSEEERQAVYKAAWDRGGFGYIAVGFRDTAMDPRANQLTYNFWRDRVCERLTDLEKQKIMAPEKMPYYFGTKRPPLEQDYYEVLNQPNVRLHDLNKAPLERFTEKGLLMADGTEYALDTIVLATGFDSFTGSLTHMGLHDRHGTPLADLWKSGVTTHLGMTIAGFPNMFMSYTPQSPTPLSNGPTIIEAQVEMIVDMIRKAEDEGIVEVEATQEGEREWKKGMNAMVEGTLFPCTDSWWNGSNIPGKKAENMLYIAGINAYEKQCRETFGSWKGFNVVKGAA